MKTIVYVDGFNLFYGCLKHSDDKWLDLIKLFNRILNEQDPTAEIVKIKFFTADIRAKIASHSQLAQQAQQNYHRALKHLYADKVDIIKGNFSLDKANMPKYKKPIDKSDRVKVWKLEEKKTDVNLALCAYRDAVNNKAEQLVFVTNDSDIEPALEFIKNDFQDKFKVGVIIPIRKNTSDNKHRPANQGLSNLADWTRSYITDEELSSSWLDDKIATNKKPILKPEYWKASD